MFRAARLRPPCWPPGRHRRCDRPEPLSCTPHNRCRNRGQRMRETPLAGTPARNSPPAPRGRSSAAPAADASRTARRSRRTAPARGRAAAPSVQHGVRPRPDRIRPILGVAAVRQRLPVRRRGLGVAARLAQDAATVDPCLGLRDIERQRALVRLQRLARGDQACSVCRDGTRRCRWRASARQQPLEDRQRARVLA